jgi:hypothetical protein
LKLIVSGYNRRTSPPTPLLHQERGEAGLPAYYFFHAFDNIEDIPKEFPAPPLLMQERGLGGEVLLISITAIWLKPNRTVVN